MQHAIQIEPKLEEFGPQLKAMVSAIESCVHCGFCLPTCPTYQVLHEEMDSPRGRIILMKAVLEEELSVQDAIPYVDRCLGCLACVSACPSGVRYGELVMPFRAYAREKVEKPRLEGIQRALTDSTLPYPGRFRRAAFWGRLARPVGGALPKQLRSLLAMLPRQLPAPRPLPKEVPAEMPRRACVALLAGCVQQVLAPEINWTTVQVLAKNGVEVLIPADQACCGAILMHTGDVEGARQLARQNLSSFPRDVDALLTNAAGCGSGMKEYGLLFEGQEDETLAREFAGRVQDVSQFLNELGIEKPPSLPHPLRAAYHDACHLTHAQGVKNAPRQLLASIPNLTLLEISEGEICCGSAGTYNLDQPEIANELGRRKIANILDSGAEAVVTGNIGCMVQIRKLLQEAGKSLPVFHTFELLNMAYSNLD